MLFTTPRLIARRLTYEDVPAMFAIYGDVETVRYVGDAEPLAEESCRDWVEVTDRNFENRGYGMVALCDRGTGELVGCIGIVHPGQQVDPEVKYAFRKDQWGQGLASEAVAGMTEFGLSNLGLTFISATVDPENHASQNVLQKSGYSLSEIRTNDDGSLTQVWKIEKTAG